MIQFTLPPNVLENEPYIDPSCFVAPSAQVIGDVRLSPDSSVWYNSVLRGDINRISIGARSNIQDGCILHLENDLSCIVKEDCIIGHGAILHGCLIEDACLIGIGAIVLSGSQIGTGSIVGAGAVVKENEIIPPFSLYVGTPAKKIKDLPKDTIQKHKKWALKYVQLAALHKKNILKKGQITK